MKFLVLLLALIATVDAKTIEISPLDKNWFEVLSGPSLSPGDEIVLASGTYSDPRRLQITQRGSATKPITIRAATGARVIFKRPDARQNSFNLAGCQYLVFKDIEITGGDAAIRIGKQGNHLAKFITLENLHIHHIGGVAITANYPGEIYEALTFRRNHIHHTGGHGEAFYLGSNNKPDGSNNGYLFNSIIENNYIHDLKGGTVSQGDGIELKDGSYGNIIRDNVIHDTNYPGIIVYDTDGKAPNVIERNVIWNTGDHGIQAAADATIRNNLIFDTKGDGIHCRNHQSAVVGNLTIVHNTILSKSSLRVIAPEKFGGTLLIANNAFGGALRIPEDSMITRSGNVRETTERYPSANSTCIGAADPNHQTTDDFNHTSRAGSNDSGAFRYHPDGYFGWKVTTGFKPAE